MSSSDSPDARGPDRRRAGKEPERSNFAQTCSLLSLYLKERGAIGVANKLEAANKAISDASMAAGPATTINLLPNTANSTEAGAGTVTKTNLFPNTPDLNAEPSGLKSMDFFAKLAAPSMEDSVGKTQFRKPAEVHPATEQMTIFYGGKVIVYNDFPADKAKDIMSEAEKYANSYCVSRTPRVDKIKFSSVIVTESSIAGMKEPTRKGNGSDLPIPIATRSSLHRFFSKRKDRVAAKAPYQVNERSNSPPPEASPSSNPWPDVEILEGQSSKQLIDLNL